MIKVGVVQPYGQVCRKETRKSGREKQDSLLAAKPGRGSVPLHRRRRGAEKKGMKHWSRGIDPLAAKLERSPTARSSWRPVRPDKKGRSQREPTDELESLHGTANVRPKGGSRREASGRQCGTIRGSNS